MKKLDPKLIFELDSLIGSTKEDWSAELNNLKIKKLLRIEVKDIGLEKEKISHYRDFFPCFYLNENTDKTKFNFGETSIHNFYRLEDFSLVSVQGNEQFIGQFPLFRTVEDFINSINFKDICRRSVEKYMTALEDDLKSA